MQEAINRYGECPNCKTSWKGLDVLEALSSYSFNMGKSHNELVRQAANYGWTPDNKICFSNLISHETTDGRNLLECPKISCQHVFDRYTGEEYASLKNAYRGIPIVNITKTVIDKLVELQTQEPTLLKEMTLPKSDVSYNDKDGHFTYSIPHVTQENRDKVELVLQKKAIGDIDDDCPFDL